MQTRRTFLKLVAAGSMTMGSGVLLPRRPKPQPAGADVQALFGDLKQPNAKIDRWSIVEVEEMRGGVIPVVMQAQDGSRFRVEIAARDRGGPRAVAETDRYALYLSNGGGGSTATVEEHGLGVMALAAALRRRECSESPKLATLRERQLLLV